MYLAKYTPTLLYEMPTRVDLYRSTPIHSASYNSVGVFTTYPAFVDRESPSTENRVQTFSPAGRIGAAGGCGAQWRAAGGGGR